MQVDLFLFFLPRKAYVYRRSEEEGHDIQRGGVEPPNVQYLHADIHLNSKPQSCHTANKKV